MKIGIRHEDKSRWEARIPLVPHHISDLVARGIPVAVQPSPQRAFDEGEIAAAGATITEDLSDCEVILGVKEMPSDIFVPAKTYAFFSHTIKGQAYNMSMLRSLMDKGCHLLDYECIVDDAGRRLVFFGVHAGLAGMIDSLWALGQRLKTLGHTTPLAELKPTLHYETLASAEADIRAVAAACRRSEPLRARGPIVIGVAGYGRVAQGAQRIAALLDPVYRTPEALLSGAALEPGRFCIVEFKEEDIVRPIDPKASFDLETYYTHPERFSSRFARYLPHLTVLVNCIYWEPRYPRLVTRSDVRALYTAEHPELLVIGDISCDIGGSIEITVKATDPGNPVYVYDVENMQPQDGFDGHGPAIMAVEILPTELPREASVAFSEALFPLIPGLVRSDPRGTFEAWALPSPLKNAIILHHGRLTPRFAHMSRYIDG